jgi:hypothetical protein
MAPPKKTRDMLPQVPVKKRDPRKKLSRGGARQPWFMEDDPASAATLMCMHVDGLVKTELGPWRARVLENLQLYAGSSRVDGTSSTRGKQLRYNLTRSITDTGAAILGAARTLPFCQTRGADWKNRRKALRRNQTLQTQFADIGVFSESQKVIYDALITGLGVLKFYEDPDRDGGTAGCERRHPLTQVWDPTAAALGMPREWFERDLVNRDVLIEMYAKDEKGNYDPKIVTAIQKAKGPSAQDLTDFQLTRSGTANQAVVYEGWHLPSSSESGDGKHIIAIPGCVLHSEEWTTPRFPFAFLHGWQPNQLGVPGTSLVDLVRPAQRRIEEIAAHVEKCQKLLSGPRVFLPLASKVQPEAITNAAAQTEYFDGPTPPVMLNWSGTPPDLEQAKQLIREETLNMLGMSTQQVQGERPAGVTSAVGQRASEDIQSKRHVMNLRFVEQYYLDCAQALVDVNDAIATERADFAVDMGSRNDWLEATKWRELMMSTKDARMAVLPISALVGSAASQFDTVQEWIAAGWVTQQTAKFLSAMPDSEGQAEEDTEDLSYANWLVDRILDEQLVALDPLASPEVFVDVARPAYLRAKRQKAPEPVLREFRRVLEVAKQSITSAEAAAAPAAPQGPQGASAPQMPGSAIADAAQNIGTTQVAA